MPSSASAIAPEDQRQLLAALRAVRKGDFSVRLPLDLEGIAGEIAEAFNDVVELNQRTAKELQRMSRVVGRDGRIGQRATLGEVSGAWAGYVEHVNLLINDLTTPTVEVGRARRRQARGQIGRAHV